jgi:hypothetical protein
MSLVSLSILFWAFSHPIVAISSQVTIFGKGIEIKSDTIARKHQLSCEKSRTYRMSPSGKIYYYDLISTSPRLVIQVNMTESACQDAIEQLEANNVACVKNGRYLWGSIKAPYYNLISPEGVIQYNMTEASCLKAASELSQF